jgi:hypothetical protein
MLQAPALAFPTNRCDEKAIDGEREGKTIINIDFALGLT